MDVTHTPLPGILVQLVDSEPDSSLVDLCGADFASRSGGLRDLNNADFTDKQLRTGFCKVAMIASHQIELEAQRSCLWCLTFTAQRAGLELLEIARFHGDLVSLSLLRGHLFLAERVGSGHLVDAALNFVRQPSFVVGLEVRDCLPVTAGLHFVNKRDVGRGSQRLHHSAVVVVGLSLPDLLASRVPTEINLGDACAFKRTMHVLRRLRVLGLLHRVKRDQAVARAHKGGGSERSRLPDSKQFCKPAA